MATLGLYSSRGTDPQQAAADRAARIVEKKVDLARRLEALKGGN